MVPAPTALWVLRPVVVSEATQGLLVTSYATAEPSCPATTMESAGNGTMDFAIATLTLSKGSGQGVSATRARPYTVAAHVPYHVHFIKIPYVISKEGASTASAFAVITRVVSRVNTQAICASAEQVTLNRTARAFVQEVFVAFAAATDSVTTELLAPAYVHVLRVSRD